MDLGEPVDPRRARIVETVRRAIALSKDQAGTPEGKNAAKAAERLRKAHRIRKEELDPRVAVRDPNFRDIEARRFFDLLAALASVKVEWSSRGGVAWLGEIKENHEDLIFAFTEAYTWLMPRALARTLESGATPSDTWGCIHLGILHQAACLSPAPKDREKEKSTSKEEEPSPEKEPKPVESPSEPSSKRKEKGIKLDLDAYLLGVNAPGLDFLSCLKLSDTPHHGSSEPTTGRE